jgi:hypothetical protein
MMLSLHQQLDIRISGQKCEKKEETNLKLQKQEHHIEI